MTVAGGSHEEAKGPARVVAIDGPAGAGKSTVARAVAEALEWRYLDTGAMYRAVALAAIESGIDPGDEAAVEELARALDIQLSERGILLDGVAVTERIRDDDVTRAVAVVSALPGVRSEMVRRQRAMAAGGPIVIEGRDIGAAVVPDAAVKVFLTASLDERARRRAAQLGVDDNPADVDRIRRAIVARDEADGARSASPFVKAVDAVEVDSTDRTVEDVVDEIVALVDRAMRTT